MKPVADAELQQRLEDGRQMLEDAAQLAALCADHWVDEESLQAPPGERIHYAVDTDLIVMYAEPWLASVRVPHAFAGAGNVHERVVALLGDLVMRRLDPATADAAIAGAAPGPLIALPPHDEENRRVVLAISRDAAADFERDGASTEDLATRLADAVASTQDPGEALHRLLGVLEADAPALAAYLNCTAPTELLRLLPRGRLVPPAFHPAFGDGERQLRRPPPQLRDDRLEALRPDADTWYQRLCEGLPAIPPRAANKLRDDAWALAYLQWVNADAASRRLRQRVVLITTNELTLKAGRHVPAAHQGFKDFTAAYLRDARALLGTKHCFAPAPTSETQFRMLEFLSVVFPNAVQQERSARPQGGVVVEVNADDAQQVAESSELDDALNLLIEAQHRAKLDGNFPAADLAKWRNVVTDTLKQLVVERRQLRHEPPWPGLEADCIDVNAFLAALVKRVQQSFADLYLSMGVIGVEQLLDANAKVRGLPALRLDDRYPGAQAQAERLSELMFRADRDPDFNLAALYAELRQEDDSNYHAHVLHAFVYASSGKWFQARTLCRVALTVAGAIPEAERAGRLGREAAYLMAVAERRLSNSEEKLAIARAVLQQARGLDDSAAGSDPRFDAEALAQDVTALQMQHFRGALAGGVDVAGTLARARELVDRVDAEPIQSVRHWVIRQAITNGLIASLVAALHKQRLTAEQGQIRDLLLRLSREGLAPGLSADDPPHPCPDEVSDFIWLAAAAHFGEQALRLRARQLLEPLAAREAPEGALPLEAKRRASLLALLGLAPEPGDAAPAEVSA